MANLSTVVPALPSPPGSPAGGGEAPHSAPTSFGHEYPAELALISLALLAVIAFMLIAIVILLVCCCVVLRRARKAARRGVASRLPPQVQLRRGANNSQTTAVAVAPDGAGPSDASLLPNGSNGAQFETVDPTDPTLDQSNEFSVQINMAPPELQNHVAQGRLESVFDECDPDGTERVKRTVLRDALLAKGFTENFVDHFEIQLNGHGAEYVTKSVFDECLKRLPSRIFMRGEDVPAEEILRVWDELIIDETSDEDSSQERPVPSGLPRPVRWNELFQELRHRGISEHFIQSYIGEQQLDNEARRDELAVSLERHSRKIN